MVKLKEVAEELDMQSDQICSFLHRSSGEIITLQTETIWAVEENNERSDYADWEKEEIALAKKALKTDEYLRFPDSFEINEFSVMKDFCESLGGDLSDEMLNLLGGSGSFKRFKQAIYRHGIEEAWYDYKQTALETVAAEWLKQNNIPYER